MSILPRFRIGNQSAFSAMDPFAPFQFALEHELGAFEWFSDRKDGHGISWDSISPEVRAWIRDAARAQDMVLSVHAPWQATPLAAEGRAALEESVAFAADVGATTVVFHLDLRDGADALAAGLEQPLVSARSAGVRLAAENTVHTGPRDCNQAFAAFSRLRFGRDVLGMCLDIGHANLCSETHHDYVRFVQALDSDIPIIHAHLHENWGERDEHLPLFTGPAAGDPGGVLAVLRELVRRGFDGALTLEVWPTPPAVLLAARDRLGELIAVALKTPPAQPSDRPRAEAASATLRG